jgi:hypothetical protein
MHQTQSSRYLIGFSYEKSTERQYSQCSFDKSCRKLYTIFSAVLRQQRKSVVRRRLGSPLAAPSIMQVPLWSRSRCTLGEVNFSFSVSLVALVLKFRNFLDAGTGWIPVVRAVQCHTRVILSLIPNPRPSNTCRKFDTNTNTKLTLKIYSTSPIERTTTHLTLFMHSTTCCFFHFPIATEFNK